MKFKTIALSVYGMMPIFLDSVKYDATISETKCIDLNGEQFIGITVFVHTIGENSELVSDFHIADYNPEEMNAAELERLRSFIKNMEG
jgi:hypothetical protein